MRKRLGLWLLLAVSATLVPAAPASAGAASWGPDFPVSGPMPEEAGVEAATVLVDDVGNATYVWEEVLPSHRVILLSRVYYADGGEGPIQSITTTDDPGTSGEFKAAIDGSGQVHVAWVQSQESCSPICSYAFQVETVRLGADGAPVGEPDTVDSFALANQQVGGLSFAADEAGEAVLAFFHYNQGSGEILLHADRISPAGDVVPLQINGLPTELTGGDTAIAINSAGEVFLAWGTFDESFHTIVEGAHFGAGANVGGVKELTGTEHPANFGEFSAWIDPVGNGTVVYSGLLETFSQVFAARLESDGETPGPRQISPEEDIYTEFIEQGVASGPGGSLLVTWSSDEHAWISRVEPDGSLDEPVQLTAIGEPAGAPVIGRAPDGSGVVLFESLSPPDPAAGGAELPILKQVPVAGSGEATEAPSEIARALDSEHFFQSWENHVAVSAGGNAAAQFIEEDFDSEATQLRGALRDGVAPSLHLFVPAKALAGEETVLAAAAEDANPVTYAWSFGDGASGSGSIVGHAFAPGSYTVAVTASDAAGNTVTKEAKVEVISAGASQLVPPQQVSPQTAILKAPPKKSRKRKATVTFISSQPGSSFECALDSTGWKPCSSPLRLKGLTVGSHRLRVRAVASSGMVEIDPPIVKFRVLKSKHRSARSG